MTSDQQPSGSSPENSAAPRRWRRLHVTSPYEAARERREAMSRDVGASSEPYQSDVTPGGVPRAAAPLVRASILICTVPRSGSWLLAEGLEATGVCGHPREYFRADYQNGYTLEWGLEVHGYADYLRGVKAAGTTANGTFGVKLHWGQFAHLLDRVRSQAESDAGESDADLMRRHFPNPQYVYLTRDDKAHQAISLYKAINLDLWWSFEDENFDLPAEGVLPAEPDFEKVAELERTLVAHEHRWERFFEQGGIDPIRVTYADLAQAYEHTIAQVFEALAVPENARWIPPPRLRKQADAQSDEWVARYVARHARS